MTTMSRIKEHMEVIGAGGVHVGTVDRVENNRIKLTKADSGEGKHKGHHHYVDGSLVADVEGNKVRVSANGDVAVTMEQEKSLAVFRMAERPVRNSVLVISRTMESSRLASTAITI